MKNFPVQDFSQTDHSHKYIARVGWCPFFWRGNIESVKIFRVSQVRHVAFIVWYKLSKILLQNKWWNKFSGCAGMKIFPPLDIESDLRINYAMGYLHNPIFGIKPLLWFEICRDANKFVAKEVNSKITTLRSLTALNNLHTNWRKIYFRFDELDVSDEQEVKIECCCNL